MVVNSSTSTENDNVYTGKGGPHGLGDPNDNSLRKVEKDILIPKKMRDRARIEKCTDITQRFSDCCKTYSLGMVVMCRKENAELHECLNYWYNDQKFREECTKEYLAERAEFRRTGLTVKERAIQAKNSVS